MITPNTKYAVDLSNDGVALWLREKNQSWQLLGQVDLTAEDFSGDFENLISEHILDTDTLAAEIRIPQSEIYVSDIDLTDMDDPDTTPIVYEYLENKTPYTAQELIFDLANEGDNSIAYVAAITKQTINEAKEFIDTYGFEAAYFTSNLDQSDYPRNPVFYDGNIQHKVTPSPPLPADILISSLSEAPIHEPEKDVLGLATNANHKDKEKHPETDSDLSAQQPVISDDITAVRGEILQTPSEPNDHIKSLRNEPPPIIEPRRLPVKVPHPKITTQNAGPIKTPQGKVAKTNIANLFRIRNVAIFAVSCLLALGFWFYSALFDGKAEIARVQQYPTTEPYLIEELQLLHRQTGIETAPSIVLDINTTTPQSPALETPEGILEPAQIAALDNIYMTAPGQAETDNAVVAAHTADTELAQVPEAPIQTQKTAELPITETVSGFETAKADPIKPKQTSSIEPLIPTKNGAIGPEGITLYLGQPDILPPRREQLEISTDPLKNILPKMRDRQFEETIKSLLEKRAATQVALQTSQETTPDGNTTEETPNLLTTSDLALKNKLPKLRPFSIAKQVEKINTSLLASADPTLATSQPKQRPDRLKIPATQEKIDPLAIEIAIQQAVRETARPAVRPKNLSSTVAKTKDTIQTAALDAGSGNGTSIAGDPSPVNIQSQATERRKINKKRMSLIGIFGKPSSRHALLRMPSGRFVKVKPGEQVSGWKVAAIGESSIRIIKGSRNEVLRMPK